MTEKEYTHTHNNGENNRTHTDDKLVYTSSELLHSPVLKDTFYYIKIKKMYKW